MFQYQGNNFVLAVFFLINVILNAYEYMYVCTLKCNIFTVLTILKICSMSSESSQPEVAPSDGDEMTCELQGIVNEFSEKVGTLVCLYPLHTLFKTTTVTCSEYSTQVEEFRRSVSQMSINTTEQQMVSQTFRFKKLFTMQLMTRGEEVLRCADDFSTIRC